VLRLRQSRWFESRAGLLGRRRIRKYRKKDNIAESNGQVQAHYHRDQVVDWSPTRIPIGGQVSWHVDCPAFLFRVATSRNQIGNPNAAPQISPLQILALVSRLAGLLVSIHVPLAGGDRRAWILPFPENVSIHAPLAGGDAVAGAASPA
jgi:hypothetical protein